MIDTDKLLVHIVYASDRPKLYWYMQTGGGRRVADGYEDTTLRCVLAASDAVRNNNVRVSPPWQREE